MANRLSSQLSFLLILSMLVSLTGCSSLGLNKPDFSKLAFWKKDDKLPLPPPPARHVDPTRFGNDVQMAIDDQKTTSDTSPDSGSLSDRLDIARSTLGASDDDRQGRVASSDNSFPGASRADDLQSVGKQSDIQLTGGQQEFKDAMSSIAESAGDSIGSASNAFKSSAYDMKAKVADAATSANDLRARLRQNADNVISRSNDFVADSRQELGSVDIDPAKVLQRAMGGNQASAGNDFKVPRSNQTLADLQQEITQGKQQIEDLRREMESTKQSAASSLAPLIAKETQAPGSVARDANQFSPGNLTPATPSPPVAKALPAPASNGFSPSKGFSPGGALSQLKPIEGDQGFGNVAPKSGSDTVYGSLAAPKSNDFNRKAVETPKYPTTSYGSFSANGAPASGVQPAGHLGTGNHMGQVRHAAALEPAGTSMPQANRIGSHAEDGKALSNISEVEIPSAILVGDGSYAPGSANQLRK